MMKRFIKDICLILLLSGAMLICVFLSIVLTPKEVFRTSYQSVIQDKYKNLLETDSPRIIIVGGSSAGFGIDEKMLESETGYHVVNLGLHAGFGGLFNTELIRGNLREGDIVLLAYEYGWHSDGYFKTLGTDLIMSGIDDKLSMYRQIPVNKYPEILGYLFTFAGKKRTFQAVTEGIYSRSSFDENGRMILDRPSYMIEDYYKNKDYYGSENLADMEISSYSIEYLTEIKKYVESKKAKVYFISCPLLEEANESTEQDYYRLRKLEEEKIGIEYISDPTKYIFPSKLMFDTIYHCNNAGEKYRTKLLIQDLKKVL